jgi:hypothetical protein
VYLFKLNIPPVLSKFIDFKKAEGRDEEGRTIGEFDSYEQAILLKSVLNHNNLSALPIGKKFKAPSFVSSGRDTNKFVTTKEDNGTIYFYTEKVTKQNCKIH